MCNIEPRPILAMRNVCKRRVGFRCGWGGGGGLNGGNVFRVVGKHPGAERLKLAVVRGPRPTWRGNMEARVWGRDGLQWWQG
eukprot:10259864-Lingulodinium_polyedra.AAC.1